MEKGLFDKLDSQYGSISTFIKALAERNDLDVAGYKRELAVLQKEFDSFGDTFTDFMVGYLQEIEQFKKDKEKWNAEKLETDEIIKRLEERVKELEKKVPKADYDYCTLYCEKEYKEFWGLLDEETQALLIVARYFAELAKTHTIDYSIIILEYNKSVERELMQKIYIPYLDGINRDYEVHEEDYNPRTGKLYSFIDWVNRSLDTGIYYIPLLLMFIVLNQYPKREYDYYYFLHKFFEDNNWNTGKICDEDYGYAGSEYAKFYRNEAAHSLGKDKSKVPQCKSETRNLLIELLKAYSPSIKN